MLHEIARRSHALRPLWAFVRLGRFQFLAGGFVLYGLGAVVALHDRPLDIRAYAWGQAAITATQLMTHYANDYFDLAADRANTTPTRWSGGSRVLADGTLAPHVALRAACVLAAVALVLDAVVACVVAPRALTLAVLLAALVVAWSYSAPPLRLHTRGLGAPSVALVVSVLTPLAGFLVQGGSRIEALLVAVTPLAFATAAMILVIDFPDAEGDRAAGKRTPVVRLGPRFTARLAASLVIGAYASGALSLCAGWAGSAGFPREVLYAQGVTIPLGLVLVRRLLRGDGEAPSAWEGLTRTGVAWLAALAAFELAAWVRFGR